MRKKSRGFLMFIIILLSLLAINCRTTTLNQNADIIPTKSYEIGGNFNFSLGYSVPSDLFLGLNFGILYRYGLSGFAEYQFVPNFQINASPITFAYGGMASFMGLLDVSLNIDNQFKFSPCSNFAILPGFGVFASYNLSRGIEAGYSLSFKLIGDYLEDFYFGPFFHLWGDFYNYSFTGISYPDIEGLCYYPSINTGFSWGWQRYANSTNSFIYLRYELTLGFSFYTTGGLSIYLGYSIFVGERGS